MRIPLVAVALFVCLTVHAGERPLGLIVTTDAGIATNRCTGVPFIIPSYAKLTVQCTVDVALQTNAVNTDGGVGLTLATGTMFPTSTGAAQSLTCRGYNADGGTTLTTHYGGHLAIVPLSTAAATCKVFERSGTEQ